MCMTKKPQSLADWIAADLEQYGYRDLSDRTGISHGALEHIKKRRNTKMPTLETLERLARWWRVPLIDVLEAAGVNMDAPVMSGIHQRLSALVDRNPNLAPLVRGFRRLPLDEQEAIVSYLEQLEGQPRRRRT